MTSRAPQHRLAHNHEALGWLETVIKINSEYKSPGSRHVSCLLLGMGLSAC